MEQGAHADDVHRRWTASALVGAVAGIVLQWWMLSSGSWNLFRWGRQSNFYDVQARALLDGTFAMDQRVLGIESFARGDQHFMYFGPVPALLRLPIVAFTRHLDGRLAAVSMLLALGVATLALLSLGWRLRERVIAESHAANNAPHVSAVESVAVGLTFFALIGGSSLLYASSRTWVYHEAILWGVALTLTSLALLLVWLSDGGLRHLIGASVFALLAILTRPSVGGGALAALGLVAGHSLFRSALRRGDSIRWHRSLGPWAERWLLTGVVAVPLAVYSVVNWLKFRTLLGVPFDQQGYTLLSQQRRDMLAANGGSLFNLDFVPTNTVSYLRPDLVGLEGVFPFVQPRRPASTIGSPFYDLIDLTSGIPTTMPVLLVLALVGVWTVLRRHRDGELRSTWPLLAGCALGTVAVLAIGYLANRYQSDFLPLLAVAALIGLPVLVRWTDSGSRRRSAAVLAVAFGLVATGTLANLALGYSYQRAYGPSTHPRVVAAYIDTQAWVDGWLGDGALPRVRQVEVLPDTSRLGDIAIVGECAGLYLSDGGVASEGKPTQWRLAELAPDSGAAAGTVVLDAAQPDAVPLVDVTIGTNSNTTTTTSNTTTTSTSNTTINTTIEVDVERSVMSVVAVTDGVDVRGQDLPLRTDVPLAWQVFADAVLGRFEVYLDGRFALYTDAPIADAPGQVIVTVGADIDATRAGTAAVTTALTDTPVCDRLLASDRPEQG